MNTGVAFTYFLILVLWELLAYTGFLSGRWPSFLSVVSSFHGDWCELVTVSGRTVWEVGLASIIGSTLGVAVGIGLATSRTAMGGPYQVVSGLKAVPATILLPVFIQVFGLSAFIVPLVTFPLILYFGINIAQAIGDSSKTRARLLTSWGVSRKSYLVRVLPFECLEVSLQTARVMIPFAFALHVALDYFLCTPKGLGCYVQTSYTWHEWSKMCAGVLLAAVVGVGLGKVIDTFSWFLLKWKRDT